MPALGNDNPSGADPSVAKRPRDRPPAWAWMVLASGVVGLVVGVVWWPRPVAYLVALAVATVGAIALTSTRSGNTRMVSSAAVVLIVGALVVVPWRLAVAGSPQGASWRVATSGDPDWLVADPGRGRVLVADRSGVAALDVRTGATQWSVPADVSSTQPVALAGDGSVLLATSSGETDRYEFVWLAPDGQELWRGVEDSSADLDGVNLRAPLAAADGVVVGRECPAGAEVDSRCTYVGVGVDGRRAWSVDGTRGPDVVTPQLSPRFRAFEAALLPAHAIIPDDDGLRIVDAATGETVEAIAPIGPVINAGGMVVHQRRATGDGLCETVGTGLMSWVVSAPCLGQAPGGVIVLGSTIYTPVEEVDLSTEAPAAVALDARTGSWANVGPVTSFGNADAITPAVAGEGVVVTVADGEVSAVDGGTGRRTWQSSIDRQTRRVGVESAAGATVVLTDPHQRHNPFAAPSSEAMSVQVYDSATGQHRGAVMLPSQVWDTVAVGPGQVVVAHDEHVFLVGHRTS